MSNDDLTNVMDALLAIPEEEVKNPPMPVSIAIQEAVDLKIQAEDDKAELESHGLDWNYVEELAVRAGACRQAQSLWAKDYRSQEEAEKEWLEKSPAAFDFRDMLLDAFRYAFRNDDTLLAKVVVIADGTSREDMIQDLNDLAVLGKANAPLLEAIKFDLAQLDTAEQLATEMAQLLAGAKGEDGATKQLDIRNRAYTFMKQAVDEVRACGKYVFSGDDNRLRGYRSEFMHKANLKKRHKSEETDDETQAA